MKKETVLFFDLFETLVKVDRGYLEAYFDKEIDLLGDLGQIDAERTIYKIAESYPEVRYDGSLDYAANYYEEKMRDTLMNVSKDIIRILDTLKSAGYRMCIISDASFTDILHWKESPLAQYFEHTVFSCEHGVTKRRPDLFWKAYLLMGQPGLNNCVFIGDGGHDELKMAKSIGMKTVKAEWFLNRRLDSIYAYTDFYAKTPYSLVCKLENDELCYFNLNGVGVAVDYTYATCSTERHAKRAQQMLMKEGLLGTIQKSDVPTRNKTDVLYVNGMELEVRPIVYTTADIRRSLAQ